MSNVFVYGTLLSEEVVDVLIRRQPRRVPGGFKARIVYPQCPQRKCRNPMSRRLAISFLGFICMHGKQLILSALCSTSPGVPETQDQRFRFPCNCPSERCR